MMLETVIPAIYTEKRKGRNSRFPLSGIYQPLRLPQRIAMLTTSELLACLRKKNIKNADIARTLDVSPSRVTEMFDGTRALKLDEAVKLVEAFSLELNGRLDPLPPAVNRLVIRHIAHEFGVAPDESQIAELMQDMRAFSEFVADPKVRRSIDAAEAFFQAMRLRRLSSEKEARQESNPRPVQ